MGIVLNWSPTAFPGALDSGAGSFPLLTDGIHDIMASHPNSLASAVDALEAKVGIDGSLVVSSFDYMLKQGRLTSQQPGGNTGSIAYILDAANAHAGTDRLLSLRSVGAAHFEVRGGAANSLYLEMVGGSTAPVSGGGRCGIRYDESVGIDGELQVSVNGQPWTPVAGAGLQTSYNIGPTVDTTLAGGPLQITNGSTNPVHAGLFIRDTNANPGRTEALVRVEDANVGTAIAGRFQRSSANGSALRAERTGAGDSAWESGLIAGSTITARAFGNGDTVFGGSAMSGGGERLRVVGAARVEGKLTVTGPIDPPSVQLTETALGVSKDCFVEWGPGSLVPPPVGALRLRYNELAPPGLELEYSVGAPFAPVGGGGGGMVIGGAVAGGLANSVLYIDGAGNLAQSNPPFTWNAGTNTLSTTDLTVGNDITVAGVAEVGELLTDAITLDNAATTNYLEFGGGSTAGLSPVGSARLRYHEGLNQVQASLGGAAYVDMLAGGGMAIGGAIAGGATSGSVLFVNAALQLAQDNVNFFWDAATSALRLGANLQFTQGVAHVVNILDTTVNGNPGGNLDVRAGAAGSGTAVLVGGTGGTSDFAGGTGGLDGGFGGGLGGITVLRGGTGGGGAIPGAGGVVYVRGGSPGAGGFAVGGDVYLDAGPGGGGAPDGTIRIGTLSGFQIEIGSGLMLGATTVYSAFVAATSAAVGTTLGVTGAATLSSTLDVSSTMTVLGDSYLAAKVGVGFAPAAINTTLDVNGDLALRPVSPGGMAVGENNYAGTNGFSFARLTPNGAGTTITGFAGGYDGKILIIVNVGAAILSIPNEGIASAPINRVITFDGATTINLAANDTVTLLYDLATARWRQIVAVL